jgi:hypothetical protein
MEELGLGEQAVCFPECVDSYPPCSSCQLEPDPFCWQCVPQSFAGVQDSMDASASVDYLALAQYGIDLNAAPHQQPLDQTQASTDHNQGVSNLPVVHCPCFEFLASSWKG